MRLSIQLFILIAAPLLFNSCQQFGAPQPESSDNIKAGMLTKEPSSLSNCHEVFCEEGKGRYTYADGSVYLGTFADGKPQGTGRVYYAHGNFYEGKWRAHTPNGLGIMHYTSGERFEGQWSAGNPVCREQKAKRYLTDQLASTSRASVRHSGNAEVKVWAVIVGAGVYRHLPTLEFTDDDACQYYAFLKSPEGGAVPDDQIQLLIDEKATAKNILLATNHLFSQADSSDVIVFYFSGHGKPGIFLPVDYDGFGNVLSHDKIKALIKDSRARYKFLIADACHSGSMANIEVGFPSTPRKFCRAFEDGLGGMACLLSSKSEEYAMEDRSLRSGVFSYFLLKGLKGMADEDGDAVITIQELFEYVSKEVRTYTGCIQTPILAGNFAPETPVAVVN